MCLTPPLEIFKSDMMMIINWQYVNLNILTVVFANNSTNTTEIQFKLFYQHFVWPNSYKWNTYIYTSFQIRQ